MKKLLLLFSIFLTAWQSKAQKSIDTDTIDFIAIRIDSLIKENFGIQSIGLKVKNPFEFGDNYIVDTVNKCLLKVIHSEEVTEKILMSKKRNDTTKYYEKVNDILITSYYFFHNRLKKVKQEQRINGTVLEYYFNDIESVNKGFTEHGRRFIVTDESLTQFFKKQASKYILHYKSFL